MAKKPTKIKADKVMVPRDDDEADRMVFDLGELQRRREKVALVLNAAIARLKDRAEAKVKPINEAIVTRVNGLAAYCTAERKRLTRDGRIKTHAFSAGSVSWRNRPPSVSIRGKEKIIEALKASGLTQFLRITHDINKEAMLADPAKANKVKGVKIGSAGEDFVVKPNHTELEEIADE